MNTYYKLNAVAGGVFLIIIDANEEVSRLVIFLIVLTTKVKVKVSRIAHFQKFHAVLAHANCSVILSYFEVRQSFIRTLPVINNVVFFS
jgi:hypothetical protein